MSIAQSVLTSSAVPPGFWSADWAWGGPLIVVTVIIHVLGLGLINRGTVGVFTHARERRYPMAVFVLVMGTMTLLATSLHAIEAGIWAFAYQLLGALPDSKSAMLYSLGAMTTFGNAGVLEYRWRLLGTIEALGGWLLFGLSTAFMFGMIQKMWLLERQEHHKID